MESSDNTPNTPPTKTPDLAPEADKAVQPTPSSAGKWGILLILVALAVLAAHLGGAFDAKGPKATTPAVKVDAGTPAPAAAPVDAGVSDAAGTSTKS